MSPKRRNHSKITQCSFKSVGKIAAQVWKKSHLHVIKLARSLHLLSCCGLNKNSASLTRQDKPCTEMIYIKKKCFKTWGYNKP